MALATVTIQGVLKFSSSGSPIGNEPVDFQYSPAGAGTYTDIGKANTDATGTATVQVQLAIGSKFDFTASFAGDAAAGANASSGSLTSFLVSGDTVITINASSH